MADAKKCDRCGKLFEPYIDDKKFTKLIILVQNIDSGQHRNGSYDLCKECNDSFLKWLSGTNDAKYECGEETKEVKENKQKECNVFGAFDGSIDCLMCPKCDECRDVTNSIKEASSDVDLEGGDANA